ncbi:MAG TPA: hypothetical protein VI172_16060 [Candidatus Dormibacteraeota bacterium]|jgi:hypothetical protein
MTATQHADTAHASLIQRTDPFQKYWCSSARGTKEYLDSMHNTLYHVRLSNVLAALD